MDGRIYPLGSISIILRNILLQRADFLMEKPFCSCLFILDGRALGVSALGGASFMAGLKMEENS